ncbi:hypothetical protein EON82_15215 [bacterium]|nr:MAG: hypothetical protein EON82_15215 [bacterium]
MRKLLPLTALLVIGGCNPSGGDRGAPAAQADLGKPLSQETLDSMPPEARQHAQASMDRGAAMKAQMDKQYGGNGR